MDVDSVTPVTAGFSFPDNADFERNQIDSPIPTDVETPWLYYMLVMPIAPRKRSAGGIIIPDQRQDAEHFMNTIGRVVAIGDGCFRHSGYSQYGDFRKPVVGDLIRYAGVNNRTFSYNGVWLVEIRDDFVRGFVREDQDFSKYRFWR